MLIKDQLRVRMDQLDISINQLARHTGVSGQSVRHWLEGRNYPTKPKIHLLEEALSCKLDFSEGTSEQSVTVDETLRKADIEAFVTISRLPPDVQSLFVELAEKILARPQIQSKPLWAEAAPLPVVPAHPAAAPTNKPRLPPISSPNHGRERVRITPREEKR